MAMETVLEQQRRFHEERERLTDAVVKEILHKKSAHKETVNSEHRMKLLLDRHMEVSGQLLELYEDADGARKEEIQALSGPNEFAEFYNRLKTIKEFHRKHPNEICVPMSVEFQEWDKMRENPSEEANLVDFSGEEGYGRFLDLHESYLKYTNLKGVEKVDYLTYMETFDQLFEIPRERKNGDYEAYLASLISYFFEFLGKVRPLLDLNEELSDVTRTFDQEWESGLFPGWPKESWESNNDSGGEHLDLSPFNNWEELASLGLDRLKSALMALGLKCGGTLEERAQRLFSTKGKSLTDIDPSLFVKGKSKSRSKDVSRMKAVAFAEAKVYRLAELVSEQRLATKENIQRKQARAQGEDEDEDEDDEGAGDGDDDDDKDDDDIPYNPKNLPLGWDGKPIPYWLYKLHGLNISYNCEICGNFTYKGPKAFQRHFAEWRHAHGMRCLGIPNTAHFANVTAIEDAMKLWDKLKNQKNDERWKPEQEEEYEDSQGNVVNKKTYDDLKRQGLL